MVYALQFKIGASACHFHIFRRSSSIFKQFEVEKVDCTSWFLLNIRCEQVSVGWSIQGWILQTDWSASLLDIKAHLFGNIFEYKKSSSPSSLSCSFSSLSWAKNPDFLMDVLTSLISYTWLRNEIEEDVSMAGDCDTSHWMIISKFFLQLDLTNHGNKAPSIQILELQTSFFLSLQRTLQNSPLGHDLRPSKIETESDFGFNNSRKWETHVFFSYII